MINPIGGYFEWEFPKGNKFSLHNNAVLLNSGRHALEYVLKGLGKIKRLWIPYFTCDVVLQPLEKLQIPYSFYHINEKLELDENLVLDDKEYLLYTNYYGIKDAYVSKLVSLYKSSLIIDNAQALFCKAEQDCHQIYSPRKYMGMPDGGIAVSPIKDYSENLPVDLSHDRCSHLLKRLELIPSDGYADFKSNSKKIAEAPLGRMSSLSRSILQSVDLSYVRDCRRKNFEYLHSILEKQNNLMIPSMDSFSCPLVYPYWTDHADLKNKLINNGIFVATYWSNVFEWTSKNDLEYKIAEHVVCIPVDQRYGIDEMKFIVESIND